MTLGIHSWRHWITTLLYINKRKKNWHGEKKILKDKNWWSSRHDSERTCCCHWPAYRCITIHHNFFFHTQHLEWIVHFNLFVVFFIITMYIYTIIIIIILFLNFRFIYTGCLLLFRLNDHACYLLYVFINRRKLCWYHHRPCQA